MRLSDVLLLPYFNGLYFQKVWTKDQRYVKLNKESEKKNVKKLYGHPYTAV